jgi:hypothetical protein
MKRYFPIALAILLIMGIAACARATPATQEPISSPPPAADGGAYHPLTTQTDVEIIDQILGSVASQDVQGLRSLVQFIDAVCTQQEGLGGPPKCRAGEAEGTPVEVLAFLGSEGGFLRKDEIGNWPGVNNASGIYAIYEVNSAAITSEQYYPIGKYVILLVNEKQKQATALRVEEGGIVRVDDIFDASLENLRAMVEREALNVILAPKS